MIQLPKAHVWMGMILLALCPSTGAFAAVFNDAASGAWDASATWGLAGAPVAGVTFPTTGDVVTMNNGGVTIQVTGVQEFCNAVTASSWTQPIVNFNGGATLTSGGLLTLGLLGSNSDRTTLTGDGTFINNGAVTYNSDGVRMILANTANIQNNGTWTFTNKGRVGSAAGANNTFTNTATGQIIGNTGATPTGVVGMANFVNAGIVRNQNSGLLTVAATLLTSNSGQYNADATRTIQLQDSTLAGTFLGSGEGLVRLNNVTMSGNVIFNISNVNGNGAEWNGGAINLGTAADTLTNQGTLVITGGSNATRNLSGNGTLINEGLVRHATDGIHIGVGDGASTNTIENRGIWRMTNKGGIDLRDAAATFTQTSTGSFETTSTAGPVSIKGSGRIVSNGGQFKVSSGATQSLLLESSASLAAGHVVTAHVGDVTFDVIAGRSIQVGGFWSTLAGDVGGGGNLEMLTTFTPATGGATVDVGGSGLMWANGTVDLGGLTLTNEGLVHYARDRRVLQNGSVINHGVFEQRNTGGLAQELELLNVAWTNNGLVDFRGTGPLELRAGTTFTNSATGIIRKSGNTETTAAFTVNGASVVNNFGAIEVTSGVLDLPAAISVPQVETVANTISAGSYRVLSSGGIAATLDMNTGNSLQTIAAPASVTLSGTTSTFREFAPHTVAGRFEVLGGHVFNTTGNLANSGVVRVGEVASDGSMLRINSGAGTMNLSGGRLEGTGTLQGQLLGTGTIAPGASAGNLSIANTLDFAGAYDWELADHVDGTTLAAGAGSDWDLTTLTGGTSDLTGILVDLNFIDAATDPDSGDPFWNDPHQWLIFDVLGGSNATNFAGVDPLSNAFNSGTFSTELLSNGQVLLNFTPAAAQAVPECASVAAWLLLAGVGCACALRRRSSRLVY